MKINSYYNEKIIPACAILAVGLVYSATLKNHLVADSWVFVYPHSFAETLGFFFKSIIPPEWKSLWLRPVPMFFFWLDNKLWPSTTWGPHLTNVVFHVINVYLIWLLVRYMQTPGKSSGSDSYGRLSAVTACLIYGLHPLAAGSVAWVAARFDVMSVTFGLAGFLLWQKWDKERWSTKYFFGALLLLLASLLSKEQGIVFVMVCFLFSFVRFFQAEKKQRGNLTGLITLSVLVLFYTFYRIIIFGGLGGYLTSQHGLNFAVPLYYCVATLFPFLNVMPGWSLSITFLAALLPIAAITKVLRPGKNKTTVKTHMTFWLSGAALYCVGLVTTAPHAGMTLETVIRHAESRFALIPIVGLSLLAGYGMHVLVRTPRMFRAALFLVVILAAFAGLRTDVQIQAWRNAGLTADSILNQTLKLAPSPKKNSTLIFIDIPRDNDQYAYIFGIGLKEALINKYGLRNDLTIIRYPKRSDFKTARPERDHVFQYHKVDGTLEKLRGVKKNSQD